MKRKNQMQTAIKSIAEQFEITNKLAKEVVEAVVASFGKTLLDTDEVRIKGLGSLKIVTKPTRNGRNPKTGEKLVIPARKAVKFTITKSLKAAIQ
jgi:nucleoid DNA-binding protein